MLTDYHTHTPLCHHAEGEPEAYVQAAISKGLREYGISDHAPVSEAFFDDWRMAYDELPKYLDWIERAKAEAKAAAGNQIKIRSGLECDWLPQCESWIEKLDRYHDWDYLIGSVHYIADQWDFDNPKWLGRWAEGDVESFWTLYWSRYLEMVQSGLFDIHGHPDLIKKFGYFPKKDLRYYYEPVIEALANRTGKACIELNTAGLRKQCKAYYPDDQFLKMAADAQVKITLTSDAHHPNEVASDFEDAFQHIKEAGFSNLCYFEKRTHTLVPIVNSAE